MFYFFCKSWILIYIGLLTIYIVEGMFVTFYNVKGKLVKLQPNKIPKLGQNKRDFIQSVKSLLLIAATLFGGISLNVYGYTSFSIDSPSWPYIIEEILEKI